jgi:hypothetical protein
MASDLARYHYLPYRSTVGENLGYYKVVLTLRAMVIWD